MTKESINIEIAKIENTIADLQKYLDNYQETENSESLGTIRNCVDVEIRKLNIERDSLWLRLLNAAS